MARQPEPTARRHRVVALGALGLLAFATVWAFGRVFTGHGPTYRLLAAALASILVAAVFERRSLLLATLVSAALLVVALGLLVFPHTTFYGLPTRETITTIARAVDRVGRQARVHIAPAPPVAPLMLAAVTAIWTAIFSAHALAVRAGSPLLAVLPPVALLAFTDTAMGDGPRFAYALVFLAAALAVVFVDGLRRVTQWGPLWSAPGPTRRMAATSARGARRVAAVAIGVAALIPGILPGLRADSLISLSGGPGGNVRVDPLVSLASQLRSDKVSVYFEVRADEPSYYRLFALDTTSDGLNWTAGIDPELPNASLHTSPAIVGPLGVPQDALLTQSFTVRKDFGTRSLPAAYQPVTVSLSSYGSVRFNAEAGDVASEEPLSAGDTYTVQSLLVQPTRDELRAVDFAPPELYGRYTEYPRNLPREIIDLAAQKAGPSDLPAFDRILHIQNWLRTFHYSEDVHYPHDISAVQAFLAQRKGFCQQFAPTMALMVRTLGYPARLAVGYTSGTEDPMTPRSYVVTNKNLHTWVEVLFPQYGWTAFEPTPTRTNPVAEVAYLAPARAARCEGVRGCAGAGRGRAPRSVARRGVRNLAAGRRFFQEIHPTIQQPASPGIPWALVARVLLAVAGLLLVFVPLGKSAWRWARLRRRRSPTGHVLAAYEVFTGEASDLGLGRSDGETVDEYRRRLAEAIALSNGHLDTLSGLVLRAAYSPRPLSESEARQADGAARMAIRDLRRNTPLVRRIVGIYRPGI